jgi:hypothetical protein
LSPQTRRGRATPTGNRRSSTRQRLDAQRRGVKPSSLPDAVEGSNEEAEYEAPHRGIVYRAQRSPMVRSFLAFTRVYIPFVLVFLVLLGGVFVYKQINPDVTVAQHWQNIQNKWEAPQTKALTALGDDSSDFSKVVLDYADLKTATAGWMSDLGPASGWAPATAAVQLLLDDTAKYVATLTQAAAATSESDLNAVSQTLVTDSQTFASEIATVRLSLGLRATPSTVPSEIPSAAPSGSGSAAPSGSASASASTSASASASGSVAPSDSASTSASASASASAT